MKHKFKAIYQGKTYELTGFVYEGETGIRFWYETTGGVHNQSGTVESVKIIPFTGKHDGNREVYEGEVYMLKLNGIETHLEFQFAVIKYNLESCGFGFYVNEPTSEYTWLSLIDKNIISMNYKGNIYENPELINPKN